MTALGNPLDTGGREREEAPSHWGGDSDTDWNGDWKEQVCEVGGGVGNCSLSMLSLLSIWTCLANWRKRHTRNTDLGLNHTCLEFVAMDLHKVTKYVNVANASVGNSRDDRVSFPKDQFSLLILSFINTWTVQIMKLLDLSVFSHPSNPSR